MKTYETMKHSIPEGATHYSDECDSYRFTWFKYDKGCLMLFGDDFGWDESRYNRDIKPIPPEEKETEPTYRYEKVEFKSDIERAKAFIDGDLFTFTHGEVVGDLEKDTYPVISLDQMVCGNAIYRRIEITERELFIEEGHKAIRGVPRCMDVCEEHLGAMYDAGCRFVNVKG